MKKTVFSIFFLILASTFAVAWPYLSPVNRQALFGTRKTALPGEKIAAVVLPHFDFVKEERKKFIDRLAIKIIPKKIIVVSVNHFSVGPSDLITTNKDWRFQSNAPKINGQLFDQITANGLVDDNEASFLNEHGISNVLPDLVTKFPEAQYLPLIIKGKTSRLKINQLLQALDSRCPDCLLVASIDFSHYNPNSLAKIHDQMSLAALAGRDPEKAWASETDSPASLYLLTQWATKTGADYFHLYLHSNSGQATNNDSLETTSYIIGYYSDDRGGATRPVKTTTFLLGGDLMFDRGINHAFKDQGLERVFNNLGQRVFWGTDIALANLEGPISDQPIDDNVNPNNLKFNFSPKTIPALKFLRLNAVSLANNHSLDAGPAGFAITKKLLAEAGIQAIGQSAVFDKESISRFRGDIPTTILAVNELYNSVEQPIIDAIKTEHAKGQLVIVFPHWGVEYQPKHSPAQQQLAHEWLDAGADLVIGSHPHVIQDIEIYKGRPIIYSLGNLVFDQTFSNATQEGLLVGGILTERSIQLSFFPYKIKNLKPQLISGQEKAAVIDRLFNLDDEKGFVKISSDTIIISRSSEP